MTPRGRGEVWGGYFFAAAVFLAVVFFAVDFLAAVFFAVDFFAALLRAVFLAVGPLARFSASSYAARSMVTDSTESALRSVALDSPSVT